MILKKRTPRVRPPAPKNGDCREMRNQGTAPDTGIHPLILLTTGTIATELGVTRDRVLHVLRSRTHIKPMATVARIRVYTRSALELIAVELGLRK